MSKFTWTSKSIINPELAQQCIQNSDNYVLKVDSIKFLGQGMDNVAFLVNQKYVFRSPRTKEAEQLLCNENLVLPKLESMLSLQIPKPVYFGKPSTLYPFHFHGYQMLEGTPAYQVNLSDDELKVCLKSLAQFLKNLHAINDVQAQEMGAQVQLYDKTQVQMTIESMQRRMQKIQERNIYSLDHAWIAQIIDQAKTIIINHDNDCLVHGDLDYRHILLQDNKLTGIIDWGDIGINHPVIDFMTINIMFPKAMHANFFETYGVVSDEIWFYAKFLALHRAITLMLYGYDDKEIFDVAVQSYERLKNETINA